MEKNPYTRNGMLMTPHATQNPRGRYPSMICIALALGATANTTAITMLANHNLFCPLVIILSFLASAAVRFLFFKKWDIQNYFLFLKKCPFTALKTVNRHPQQTRSHKFILIPWHKAGSYAASYLS